MTDYFASSTLSLILAWVFCLPMMIAMVAYLVGALFERYEGVPKPFFLWVTVCILVFSPFRYMILQLLVGASYPVQSASAFLSTLVLAAYVPIVFGVMYAVGVGLPFLAVLIIAAGSLKAETMSKGRQWLAAAACPFLFTAGYMAFFFLLQYAAISTHWLRAEDVVRATNGPAEVAYRFGLGFVLPLPVSSHLTSVINTDRNMLRAHVATYYLSNREFARYVERAYPLLYEELSR